MIGYLKGEVAAIYEDRIILEVGGIGYNIFMPASGMNMLGGIGEEIKVYTYLSVREDAMLLYGFLSKDDLDFFKLLISVNGIGPKAGLSILSYMTADELRFAILSEDSKKISKAPGIGAKSAQRIIIELKDKMNLEEAFEEKLKHTLGGNTEEKLATAREEAAMALTALGYSTSDSYKAVRDSSIGPDDDTETVIKKALRLMSKY